MRLAEGLWHHGTMADFEQLALDVKMEQRPVGNWYGYLGLHFTRDRQLAENHATLKANDRAELPLGLEGFLHSRVLTAHVSIDKALVVDDETALDELSWQVQAYAIQGAYDPSRHPSKYAVLDERPGLAGRLLRQSLLEQGYDSVIYENLGAGDDLRNLRERGRQCLVVLDPARVEIVAVNPLRPYDDLTPMPIGARHRLSPLAV